jgi:hypothetical protein
MSSRPIPADLLPWALASLPAPGPEQAALTMIAGDAGNRRYFRLAVADQSYIAVEAPPDTEKNAEFVAVRGILADAGVRVPGLLAVDMARGFMLLEDLGDRMLLSALNPDTVDGYYHSAFAVLRTLAAVGHPTPALPAYDQALLSEELSRFGEWFVEALLGHSLQDREKALIAGFGKLLLERALEQPRVLVHRDFHSRNLMLLADGELAAIDFQDAVMGPVTYDLASLLKDCYIHWPANRVRQWALEYKDSLNLAAVDSISDSQFLRWFDWMGLQRHIKVLGTFARLSLRDGKSGYLEDLPLVIRYVEETLAQYAGEEPAFAGLQDWFAEKLSPLIALQAWSAA